VILVDDLAEGARGGLAAGLGTESKLADSFAIVVFGCGQLVFPERNTRVFRTSRHPAHNQVHHCCPRNHGEPGTLAGSFRPRQLLSRASPGERMGLDIGRPILQGIMGVSDYSSRKD
jgi:hypothetical protein